MSNPSARVPVQNHRLTFVVCRTLRGSLSSLKRGPKIRSKNLEREHGNLLDTSSSLASISGATPRMLTEAEIPEHLPELRLISDVM